MRFNSHGIKTELENLCMEGVSVCIDKFIGPIKNGANSTKDEKLFFISFDQQIKIQLDDFSYKESNTQNLNGHIFGLFEASNLFFNKQEKNKKIVEHLKTLKNLGNQINKVYLVRKNTIVKNNGVLIHYNLGDKCKTDESNYIILYNFIQFY